jgi:hypothetical protein
MYKDIYNHPEKKFPVVQIITFIILNLIWLVVIVYAIS